MKTITVVTNDSANPETNLTVSGNVEKFATITPSVLRLNGNIGKDLKSMVKIVPESKYPFSIAKIRAQDGKNIKYELKETNSASGVKEYSVTVENLKKDAGSYYDVLILETDSKLQPEIKINVMARLIDPDAPAKAPLAGNRKNLLAPGNGRRDAASSDKGGSGGENGKNFLEVIQKIQQQNATGANADVVQNKSAVSVQDPKRAEELKKKFEALIKEAQEKQKTESMEKKDEEKKTTE